MKAVTAKEMKEIDKKAKEEFLIPTLILMENAGRAVAEAAKSMLAGGGSVLVICGKGNNGGDGLSCARHLANWGYGVTVALAAEESDIRGDAKTNYEIAKRMGIKIVSAENSEEYMKQADLIIDALLGTGLSRPVKDPHLSIIKSVNASKKSVLSVDVPSGLCATTGNVLGACIKADRTVTFAAMKRGLITGKGPEYAGDVIVAYISIPRLLLK